MRRSREGDLADWGQGDKYEAAEARLEEQIDRLCRDAKGQPLTGFRLALMHHPLTDLAVSGGYHRLVVPARCAGRGRNDPLSPRSARWRAVR